MTIHNKDILSTDTIQELKEDGMAQNDVGPNNYISYKELKIRDAQEGLEPTLKKV